MVETCKEFKELWAVKSYSTAVWKYLILTICIGKRAVSITLACFQTHFILYLQIGNFSYNTRNTINFRVKIHKIKSVILAQNSGTVYLKKKNENLSNNSKKEYATSRKVMHSIFVILYIAFAVNTLRLCFNGSQLAKMKKYIPDMSLPCNLEGRSGWSKKFQLYLKNCDFRKYVKFGAISLKFGIL